jgi:dienelactone hydrolase
MPAFLALLAFLQTAGLHVQRVSIPGPDGVALDAVLVIPEQPVKAPGIVAQGIVAMHGCGGPFAIRDGQWAEVLARAGHYVILPDSFGSRGLGSQCGVSGRDRTVTPSRLRRGDAIASARWLLAQPGVPQVGVAMIGWSNGGSTVLATADAKPDLPPGLFRRFVAFYPGCEQALKDPGWRPSAPLFILMGESDDWTPAPPCHDLQARFPGQITLITYPDAYHDFDAPGRAVKIREGAATVPGGRVHTGTNEAGRQDALARVPAWLEAP